MVSGGWTRLRGGRAALALAALALLGCPSLRAEWADYNPQSFQPMASFAFAPEPKLSTDMSRVSLETRKANRALATREIRAQLEATGYAYDPGSADFVVHFLMGEVSKDDFQVYQQGLQGELQIWLVRRGERDRFWDGWAHMTLYGKIDVREEIEQAVVKVLERVPPRS